MGAYAIRRIIQTIPILVLTSIAVFFLLRLVPGDPAVVIAGPDASPKVLNAVREDLGLNKSIPTQYLLWIGNALHGDLGHSYISRMSVWKLIMLKLPATLELTAAALILALLIAIPTGIIAGVRQRTKTDIAISTFTAVGLGLPNFWIGIIFILLFALVLGWLPPGGRVGFGEDPVLALKYLALPALTLAIPQSAIFSRFLKIAVVEVMHDDFVRTARAKGLAESAVVFRHVLRNALIPVVTVLGMQFGRMLGGAVIIESVFAWPGVGRLMLDAIGRRDYAVIQGGLFLLVTMFVLINLLTDLAYGLLDPRIRHG